MYKTPVRRSAGALHGSVSLSLPNGLVQVSVRSVAVTVRVGGAGQRQMVGHCVRGERSRIVDGRRMDDVRCHRVRDLQGDLVNTCVRCWAYPGISHLVRVGVRRGGRHHVLGIVHRGGDRLHHRGRRVVRSRIVDGRSDRLDDGGRMGVVQRSGVRVAQRSGMLGVGQRHGRMAVGSRMAVGVRSGDVRRGAQVAGGDGGEQQRKNALQTKWE